MNKKIKVCHVITRFLRGGGAKNTFYTIRGLDHETFEIHLIVGKDVYWDQVNELRNIKTIQVKELVRNPNPVKDIKALISLFRIMKREKYDIVHTHLAKAGFIGRLAAFITNTPIIVHSVHGITFPQSAHPVKRRIYLGFERIVGKFTSAFVPVGEDLKESYVSHKIGEFERYTVIRSGMNLGLFFNAKNNLASIQKLRIEFNININDLVLGYVASLEERKGHKYAIKVAQRIVHQFPNAKFLFVGEGHLKHYLESEIKREGLENNIILTGYRSDIHQVMGVFDLKIFTSLWEGLPQVLVQAAAVGLPIVAFDADGVCEVVKEGINGFIVKKKDVKYFADRIIEVLSNLDHYKEQGLYGKRIVNSEWEIETMVKKTSALYKKLYIKNNV